MPAEGRVNRREQWSHFGFAAAAYVYNRKRGKAATTIGKAVNPNLPDGPMGVHARQRNRHEERIGTWAGTYAIRIAIRDNVTGKISSIPRG